MRTSAETALALARAVVRDEDDGARVPALPPAVIVADGARPAPPCEVSGCGAWAVHAGRCAHHQLGVVIARGALAEIRDRVRAARAGEHLDDLLGELERTATAALEATEAGGVS